MAYDDGEQDQINWQPVGSSSNDGSGINWKPVAPEPSKSPEPDWGDWAIEQGLSIVPPIAGAMLGGPAGGALGGFGGSYLRQLYDVNKGFKKEINPLTMGVEAALGGLPIPGHIPGAGATAEELMKYAAKAPLRGAAEGAVIGGGASIPMSYAETGEAPSWGEVGKSALAGGAFGLAGGAAFGSLPAYTRAHAPETPPAFMRPGNIVPPTEPPTGGAARPLSDEMPAFMRSPSHEVNEPPPVTQQPPPQIPPESALAGVSGQPVAIKGLDEAAKANLRKQGYKPNGFDADGFPIWALPPGGAQKSGIAEPPAGTTPFHEDDVITIPKANMRDKTFVQNLMNGGMELVGRDEQGNGLFKRNLDASNDTISSMEGPPLRPDFTQGQGAQEGEQTGRVAPFGREQIPEQEPWDQLWKRYLDLESRNDNGSLSPADSNELNRLRFTIKDHPGWKAKVDNLAEEAKNDPATARRAIEFFTKGFPDDPINKPLSLGETSDLLGIPEEQLRQTLEPDTVDPAVRDNLLTKLRGMNQPSATPDYADIIKSIRPTDRPIIPDRPVSFDINNPANEISPTGDVSEIRRRNTLRPVENQSDVNLGQFTDDQIRQYLIKEDATPPEAHDINMPPDDIAEARDPRKADQMYGPGEFQKEIETIPRMSVEKAQATAEMYDRMINTVRENNPEKVNTIKQLTIIRDTAIDRVKGKIPSTWGTRAGIEITQPKEDTISEAMFKKASEGKTPDEFIRMEVGDREDLLRNMVGQYAEHGARVANKELLQNAIDATPTGGTIDVTLNYNHGNADPKGHSITVKDEGPGLPIDLIKNEYVTLTGSGKRGVGAASGRKSIGEMGVGKATYLLGVDSFEVKTIAKEPDGTTWKYEFSGDPEAMITSKIKVNKTQMPDGTQTGTEVKIYDQSKENMDAAEAYLNTFGKYSDSPVNVNLKGNKYSAQHMQAYNLDEKVTPRTMAVGQQVTSGSAPGGDYQIYVPDTAKWNDRQSSTVAIITSRGMFQGAETIYMGGYSKLPDRLVINIDPTVPATDAKLYPLTAPTRERMKDPFRRILEQAVDEYLVKPVKANQKADLQAAYNALQPAVNPRNPSQVTKFVTNDRGGRYTPQELQNFNDSPIVHGVADEMKSMLDTLDGLFPTQQTRKTTKFGFDLADIGEGGVNVPNLANSNESAILINLHDAVNQSNGDPVIGAERIAHAILHEFNHNIVREEGAGFTWQLIDTDSKFGTRNRANVVNNILQLISDSSGNYVPEVLDLLQEHSAARGRPDTTLDFIARQKESRFARSTGQEGVSYSSSDVGEEPPPELPVKKEKEPSVLRELYNAPRAFTTPLDLSASARQGLPLVTRKEWWTSWKQQLSALGSEKGYQKTLADLKKRPLFQANIDMTTGKVEKSFAEKVGMKLSDVSTNLNKREESIASNWLETGKMFGKDNPVQGAYKATIGDAARASNRAYTAFLNQLRADTFESLLKEAHADFSAGTKGARNPYEDLTFAREIADYVNTATGRGPLKIARPTIEGGRVGLKESSFEQHAKLLTDSLFSPRLFASRVRMLNPGTYMMASPFVRKQYVKSLLSVAGAWGTIAALGKMAGADVSLDPNSADFGKIRIGNTRLDPAGGFQQYLVAASRLISGHTTSSASGTDFELGQGYRPPTRLTIAQNFAANKLHPVLKFGYDLLNASQHQPFNVADRTAQLFVPLIVGDVVDLAKEDPSLLPLIAPISLGMGSQTYDKGQTQNKFVPQGYGYDFTGGNPF